MKTTIVIYGSSTGSCQSIAETIASKLGVEAVDVANIDDATIASHENLILGTSTWGAGEMQDDWYDGVKTLKSAGLAGKTVALFGCGDSESYPDRSRRYDLSRSSCCAWHGHLLCFGLRRNQNGRRKQTV